MPNQRLSLYVTQADASGHRHGVDPGLILALLDRESTAGLTLRPVGPMGTGDWAPRKASRYRDMPIISSLRVYLEEGVEWCTPKDGMGWGRGLMQIDFAHPDNAEFLAKLLPDGTPAWQDATENIDFGTQKLAGLVRAFAGDEGLAAAAYNASEAAVRRAVSRLALPTSSDGRQRAADSVTTGRNYGSDVLARRQLYRHLAAAKHAS